MPRPPTPPAGACPVRGRRASPTAGPRRSSCPGARAGGALGARRRRRRPRPRAGGSAPGWSPSTGSRSACRARRRRRSRNRCRCLPPLRGARGRHSGRGPRAPCRAGYRRCRVRRGGCSPRACLERWRVVVGSRRWIRGHPEVMSQEVEAGWPRRPGDPRGRGDRQRAVGLHRAPPAGGDGLQPVVPAAQTAQVGAVGRSIGAMRDDVVEVGPSRTVAAARVAAGAVAGAHVAVLGGCGPVTVDRCVEGPAPGMRTPRWGGAGSRGGPTARVRVARSPPSAHRTR